ncbi:HAMP domain-containing protein [Agrobacterium vitis]|uniref:methyl-accepting chemotaxis protein n=1 Tax=Agrobacterium vitis TaxID=373 RepID=UPI0012E7E365|nr:methyl-accepting chemotaxis protein [Agrobacterium vitis]MCF1468647.1 methyl-accepting chemotaxis protein [Agrobacterium vitis]MVA79820.1 HAMP domain-containing protein [Agrobacterium vitis]
MRIISALPFKVLLTSLGIVPLLAAIVLGAILSWEAWENYMKTSKAVTLEQLARDGGNLLLVMPLEGAAPPAARAEARATSDAAYAKVVSAYDDAIAAGYDDAILNDLKNRLVDSFSRIGEFRYAVDADRVDPIMPLKYLQPVSAMGMELAGRAANLVDDRLLSQGIQGYYSLLQVNDSYLIINRIGQVYTQKGALSPEETSRFHSGFNKALIYLKPMQQFVPKPLIDQYEQFWRGNDVAPVQKAIDAMAAGRTYTPAAGDLDTWNTIMAKRRDVVAGLIKSTSQDLGAFADAQLSDARNSFYVIVTVLGILVLVTALFSISVLRILSNAIRRISGRMAGLAEGDKASAIPYLDRKDEIGDIAHSVEVFRQAALRNDELERSAQENRRRAEIEREEMQAKAEAEANERLARATGALAAGLRQLAAGDLLCEIQEQFAPQFEALRHDFNTSVNQLRSVLISVGISASGVRNGSGEISDASDDLSKRTETQAASLEQTAAALEEITANVKATSLRTGQARDLVRDARSRADRSSNVVGNAVTAMGRIENASRQIVQIIGVIDEIAFQTNLLALNAGVEAARAGEAGKGFAVVAQEVRELAQRSANAAKEIKQLIGNSEVAVSEGVKLVNDTGEGLGAIAKVVEEINEHMDAIATAAQEQSVGLGEVNVAVNHMDQATQQNAAMVEEMNAAGAGLADEAAKLSELLANFKTGHQNSGRATASAGRADFARQRVA